MAAAAKARAAMPRAAARPKEKLGTDWCSKLDALDFVWRYIVYKFDSCEQYRPCQTCSTVDMWRKAYNEHGPAAHPCSEADFKRFRRTALEMKLPGGQNDSTALPAPFPPNVSLAQQAFNEADYGGKAVPIYINSYNRRAMLEQMVNDLLRMGYRNLTILDNNSTYPPLLDYLRQLPVGVSLIRLRRNEGHLSLFKLGLQRWHAHEYFAYTDPDLDLSTLPWTFIGDLITLHKQLHAPPDIKVGPALRLDNLPRCSKRTVDVITWEQQFWRQPVLRRVGSAAGTPVFDAKIDTTFALYPPGWGMANPNPNANAQKLKRLRALRVGGAYAVGHPAWGSDKSSGLQMKWRRKETAFYLRSKRADIGHWSGGRKRHRPPKGGTRLLGNVLSVDR